MSKIDTKPLTPTQRQIMALLREHGSAVFVGGKGSRNGLQHWLGDTGLVIRAYQTPEFFLKGRGLIERVESNSAGYRYRLTDDGARRAATLHP